MHEREADRALTGLRVLDLMADNGYAGKLFADQGADVILVEPPSGNRARLQERPEVFAYWNAGKRSLALNLDDPADQRNFALLCQSADIVLDQQPQAVWAERGLDYATLSARHPGLVWCSVTPFGQTGPFAGFKGNDAVAMATGGMAWLTGYEDTGPMVAAGRLAQYSAGQYAAVMALMAAYGRENVGSGQFIDVSLQEVVALGTETAPQFYDLKKIQRRRLGERERQAGVGTYPCKDGYILLYASEEGLGTGWTRLVEWLKDSNVPDAEVLAGEAWLTNRYKTTPEAMATFRRIFGAFAERHGKQYLFEEGQRRRIAVAPINDASEILADTHLKARKSFSALALDDREITCPGAPFRLSETPSKQGTRAPELDADGAALRAELAKATPATAPVRAPTGPRRLPLEGLRVVDFTWVGAGPFTTKLLADFGAEVIKIESPSRPDQLRRAEPLVGGRGINESGYFANRNTHKKSLALDMKAPNARDTVLALMRHADVLANSFSPGVMDRWRLSYDDVRQVNPRAITLSMPLSGESGPYRNFLGYGMSIAALIGLFGQCGLPGRVPVGTGTNYPDHLPNPLHAAFGLLAALYYSRRTGRGQKIEVAQIESSLAVFPEEVLRYAASGELSEPGSPPPYARAYGVFRCSGEDQWCVVAPETESELEALRILVGQEDGQELVTGISAWMEGRTAQEAMNALQQAGVPAGAVYNPEQLVTNPQLTERGFWQYLDHPVMGRVLYHGIAARWSVTSTRYRKGAPLLGEHTNELERLLIRD